MLRIFIADDHPIFRQGLKQILSDTSGMAVADEAGTGEEALTKVLNNTYDILLLDISLPGKDGFEILQVLQNQKPNLPVLVLSAHPEEQYAIRAFKLGASGYVTKEHAPDELIQAIRKVSEGRKYISTAFAEQLAADLDVHHTTPQHEHLSNREFQVLLKIAEGKRNRDIAGELCLSEKTISTYRLRILQKMHLKNNAEIIQYALRKGLLENI